MVIKKKCGMIGLVLVTILTTLACALSGITDSSPADIGSHTGKIRHLAFNADGTQLASGNMSAIKLWDMESGEEHTSFDIAGVLIGISFEADGAQIISVDTQHVVKFWDAATGELAVTHEILTGFDYTMVKTTYKPQEHILAITNAFGDVWFWNTERNVMVTFWPMAETLGYYPISDMAFNPNSNQFVFGTPSGVFAISDYSTYPGRLVILGIDRASASNIAFSPDGKLLAFASGTDIFVHSFEANERVAALSGHSDTITDIAFSPDGTTLATASLDCSIRLWDWEDEEQLAVLEDTDVSSACVVFSPDGTKLAFCDSAPCGSDGSEGLDTYHVRLWDVSRITK